MSPWIKIRSCLQHHPKVVALALRLSVTRTHAIGALALAWIAADEHADLDGRVRIGPDTLDALVELPGFARAMVEIGWLAIEDDSSPTVQFVNYQEHNGSTAKSRALAAKRMSALRSRDGDVALPLRSRDTECAPEKRREEKRREDTNCARKGGCGGERPTLDQVRAYCQERGNRVDPEAWYAHYESNGWRVGRNPMRDWKAAVRTWERNNFGGAKHGQQRQSARYDPAVHG